MNRANVNRGGPQRKRIPSRQLLAAATFRDGLTQRADQMEHGIDPLWYGWALVDAFNAGVEWARMNGGPTKSEKR